ncbi:hypothetical protein [Methylomonas sp. CM2]|uniref:hypothetical protein n=1 Tax=Methylomonas sp. CM2 TaxID=3417647 RepID=UPI003CF410BD
MEKRFQLAQRGMQRCLTDRLASLLVALPGKVLLEADGLFKMKGLEIAVFVV